MKTLIDNYSIAMIIVAMSFFISINTMGQEKDKLFIAIELNNVLCGYSEVDLSDSIINGKEFIIIEQNTYANFHALGQDISQYQKFTYHVDAGNGNFIYHDSYHKQGEIEMGGAVWVKDNMILTVDLDGNETTSEIPDEIILPNTQFYPYLLSDPEDTSLWTKKFMVYDLRSGKVKEMKYTKLEDVLYETPGKEYDAIVLEESDPPTGSIYKLWISKEDGMRLQMELPQKIKMYLTDASVPKKIKTGNLDDNFFIKTNKNIKDIRSISYMKATVKLATTPSARMEDLRVPGQKFSGTINDKAIDGEFIIQHKRYKGKDSPSFPFDPDEYVFEDIFVEAEENIESDDPELEALAKKITEGSENLWDASCRISRWVATNIKGSILDGSAKETYDTRSGLCGAQSRLMAALCRAAGIPARVVWGCMYTREYDGSFGHHGWNEVYMGDAGWIPIDVTIHETDYIDSGHIRLGVLKSPQTIIDYEEMEILDYTLYPGD